MGGVGSLLSHLLRDSQATNAAIDPQNTTKKPITKALRDHTVVAAIPPATQKVRRTVEERLIGHTFLRGAKPLPQWWPAPSIFILSWRNCKGAKMKLVRCLVAACSVALLASLQPTAEAVALRPNKATDDSVCDLAHDTVGFLGGSMLIPSSASQIDQVDAYFRLASTFVTLKCANGQLLILQGMSGSSIAPTALHKVASSSCASATVGRTEITVPLGGRAFPGFELRCVISKRDELAAKLSQLEQADPMSELKARLLAAARDPAGGTPSSHGIAGESKDCDKFTLASLLQGGACKK